MVSAYDVVPTLLDYLGLPLPEGRNLPGRSFVPVLKGEPGAGHEIITVYDDYGLVRTIRTGEWKYVHRYPDGPHDLYDPGQRPRRASQPGGRGGPGQPLPRSDLRSSPWSILPDR